MYYWKSMLDTNFYIMYRIAKYVFIPSINFPTYGNQIDRVLNKFNCPKDIQGNPPLHKQWPGRESWTQSTSISNSHISHFVKIYGIYPFYPLQLSLSSPVLTSHQSHPRKTITCQDCDLHYAWRRHYSSSALLTLEITVLWLRWKFIAILYKFKEVSRNWKCFWALIWFYLFVFGVNNY